MLQSLLIGLTVPALAIAQTSVGGAITSDVRWTAVGSPYVVVSDVVVETGGRLLIDAGVTVSMGSGTSLIVQTGSLQVQGRPDRPVSVLSDQVRRGLLASPGDWERWVIGPGSTDTSISHAVIEHGKGVSIQGSAPAINHVAFRNHLGPAIALDLAASPYGVGNSATGNLLNGIEVPPGEVTGQVRWGLRGLPYVIGSGVLSIGLQPRIQAVSPTTIQGGQSITVNLFGSRLTGLASPRFDNPDLTALVLPGGGESNASLTVVAASSARSGPVALTVQTDAGAATLTAALTVVQTTPEITGLEPSSLVTNQGPVDLRVTGRQFNSTAVVLLDGSVLSTSFVSSSELRASVPNITIAGTPRVQVRIADPAQQNQFVFSNAVGLPVLAAGPLTLAPSRLSVVQGGRKTLNVVLPYAAPEGGMTITLSSSAASVATVPGAVTLAPGATSAAFEVTALQEGSTVVTASRPGFVAAQSAVNVNSEVSYSIAPQPLVALPGGAPRSFTIEASDPVAAPVEFAATTANASIASVGGDRIVLPPGATSAQGTLTGVTAGTTTLYVQRIGGGAPLETQVTVGEGLTGGAVAYGRPIGLVREAGSAAPPDSGVGPISSRPLGLSRSSDGAPPAGADVGPIASRPLGLSRSSEGAPPAGTDVGPIASRPVGLTRAQDAGVPPGAPVGPVMFSPLGLVRDAVAEPPAGAAVIPIVSKPVGLSREQTSARQTGEAASAARRPASQGPADSLRDTSTQRSTP